MSWDRALRLDHAWEIVAWEVAVWEIAHLGSCQLGKIPLRKHLGRPIYA